MADIHQISPDPTSSSDSTSSAKVPQLIEDGSNWILYCEQFLTAVFAKGLRRYIEGTERVPIPPTAPGVDSDADGKYDKAYDRWLANHAAVKSLLLQTVPDPLKIEILPLRKASELWMLVSRRYDSQGDFVQAGLLSRMQALRVDEGADPRPVLSELARLRSEYLTAGGIMPDEFYKSAYYVSTDFSKVSTSNGISFSRYLRLIDSGASRHFDPHQENFVTFPTIPPVPINSADGRVFHATGVGSIRI
ncbi:hypothetical protein C8Q80DRAFT_1069223, partial [Daedaleopsis nitida]